MNEAQALVFQDLVNALLKNPESYREIIPALSRHLDSVFKPEPTTLEELANTHGIGTIFELTETGESYQLAGYVTSEFKGERVRVAVRAFNSDFIDALPLDTKIRRVF